MLCVIPFIASSSIAADARPFPTQLFDITLGAKFDLGNPEAGDLGNLPVKKFAGVQNWNNGINYYFRPLEDNEVFEYREFRDKSAQGYFKTTHMVHLFPIIPDDIDSFEKLQNADIEYESSHIGWSDILSSDDKKNKDAYWWAIDLCKTVEADLAIKPEIVDFPEDYWYQCTFSGRDAELTVYGKSHRSFGLSLKPEVKRQKSQAVDKKLRKLKARQFLPY